MFEQSLQRSKLWETSLRDVKNHRLSMRGALLAYVLCGNILIGWAGMGGDEKEGKMRKLWLEGNGFWWSVLSYVTHGKIKNFWFDRKPYWLHPLYPFN